jgi:RNA polymerase sigma-70 factor, ECF subfamily
MERFDDKTLTAIAPIDSVPSTARLLAGSMGRGPFELLPSVSSRLSDETLVALAAEDDSDAFALLYERYVRAAVALATQMCKRPAIAEEVVQEAFLSFWRGRRHFDRSRGSVRAWVLGIVRNRAIDVLRQNVAHELADGGARGLEDLLDTREHTEGEVGRRALARELLAALDGLPPEQSCVITLAYYGGYTQTEIASMLNTPIGTVKGRMRLGLRKMAGSIPIP